MFATIYPDPFLPASQDGFKYALILVDHFTKWPELVPLKEISAPTIATAIHKQWICWYGIMQHLHSYGASNVHGNVMRGNVILRLNIRFITSWRKSCFVNEEQPTVVKLSPKSFAGVSKKTASDPCRYAHVSIDNSQTTNLLCKVNECKGIQGITKQVKRKHICIHSHFVILAHQMKESIDPLNTCITYSTEKNWRSRNFLT